uniref:DUF1713 domain-containing protein n=1 Tax=Macrostomum lignano TaxID=282301 RepID=A0A1I8F5S5_9PLAT
MTNFCNLEADEQYKRDRLHQLLHQAAATWATRTTVKNALMKQKHRMLWERKIRRSWQPRRSQTNIRM